MCLKVTPSNFSIQKHHKQTSDPSPQLAYHYNMRSRTTKNSTTTGTKTLQTPSDNVQKIQINKLRERNSTKKLSVYH